MNSKKFFLNPKGLKKTFIAGLVALLVGCVNPVLPKPPVQTPIQSELSSNTYVLTSGETSQISEVTDASVTFSNSVPYSAGDIIVSDITDRTPNGLLRKISFISGNTVYTVPASLEDAVKNVSFEAQRSIFAKSSSSPSSRAISLVDYNIPINNVVIYDLDGDSTTIDDQAVLNGNVAIASDIYLSVDIKNNLLNKMTFKNISTDSVTLQFNSNIEKSNVNLYQSVKKTPLPPFKFALPTTPPFPVVILPVLETIVGAEGNFSVTAGAGISQNATMTLGLGYDNGSWVPIKNFSNNFSYQSPNISSVNSVKIYTGVKMDFLLYGVAGPYGNLNAYLRLDNVSDSLGLYGGLEGIIGVTGTILGRNIANYSYQVLNYEKLLAQISPSQPPAQTTTVDIQPGPEGKDAYLREEYYYSDKSYSYDEFDSSTLETYSSSASPTARVTEDSYIQFPLDSIPSNANITSAKVKLYGYSPENLTVNINKITNPWSEYNGSVTASSKPSYSNSYSSFSMIQYQTQWYESDVTQLVREWVLNPSSNYGMALTAGGTYTNHQFNSSDNSNLTTRPILEVTYSQ